MTTRSRKSLRWSRFLPVLAANGNDLVQQNVGSSFSEAQTRRWHAFETLRERHRTHYEAAEVQRDNAHRAREDAFRAFMGDLHAKFLEEEELRAQDYDRQELLVETDFRQAEDQRQRDFDRDEESREEDFIILFDACFKHAQWHADLRTRLFAQQERENDVEWTKLEQWMVQKFELLRVSLNAELTSLATERNRPAAFNVTAPSSVSSDDLRIRFPGTKSVSPVIIPRGLPDEDSVPERQPQFPGPILSFPQPPTDVTNARQSQPSMPFPRSEPLSPVLMSTPSRRARSRSPRVYSSTEPRASTHLSRSPSPAPEMPPMPEILANFPETPSTLPHSAQFAALIDRQATVFASDEVFFHNHFSQAEADRDNAEQQRTTFFVAAEGERDRWFRALEEQREARSADAEFARRGGEEARSRAFEDHNSRRHWRCQTAQFRIEREYESAKSAHVDALCTRQNRMVRLIEVHKHVITALRTRIAVLRTGAQTPHERPHYGHPMHEIRARGPNAHAPPPHAAPPPAPPPPPPPPPPPLNLPPGQPAMPEPRSASPETPYRRTWIDPSSPTSSRARNRHSRARWHSSFYLHDAVEFVPSAILKKPAVRVALPIIAHTADVTMVYHSNQSAHHRHYSSSGKEDDHYYHHHEKTKVSKKRRSLDASEQNPDEVFSRALDRQSHTFEHEQKQRADQYTSREVVRATNYTSSQGQRTSTAQASAQERGHTFADGQRARLAAGRAEEARRRAAASEWQLRRAWAFGQSQIQREAKWRQQTALLHDSFVGEMSELSESLSSWTKDVMIEYESDLPFAKPAPVQ